MKKEKQNIAAEANLPIEELKEKIHKVSALLDRACSKGCVLTVIGKIATDITRFSIMVFIILLALSMIFPIPTAIAAFFAIGSVIGIGSVVGIIGPVYKAKKDVEKYESLLSDLRRELVRVTKEKDRNPKFVMLKYGSEHIDEKFALQHGNYYKNIDKKYKRISHMYEDADFKKKESPKTLGQKKSSR